MKKIIAALVASLPAAGAFAQTPALAVPAMPVPTVPDAATASNAAPVPKTAKAKGHHPKKVAKKKVRKAAAQIS